MKSAATMLPKSVAVIGAGSWGSALAIVLSHNIRQVVLVGRDAKRMTEMAATRCNHRYLPGVQLPPNIHPTASWSHACTGQRCFLLAVPSGGFRASVVDLKQHIQASGATTAAATILFGTKGFDPHTGQLLSAVITEICGSDTRLGVLSGPSFAAETAAAMPTALTLASANLTDAQSLARWFHTPTTRIYFSTDPIGVQLGGAIKNVMAIAAGISDGLGYGANARAALITRGLAELTQLGTALGGKVETFMGLTGVGDLILTCTDDQSRNRRFGLGIGAGQSQAQITAEIGQEIEGIRATAALYALSQQRNIELPITEQVYHIIYQQRAPRRAVQQLLERQPRAESAALA